MAPAPTLPTFSAACARQRRSALGVESACGKDLRITLILIVRSADLMASSSSAWAQLRARKAHVSRRCLPQKKHPALRSYAGIGLPVRRVAGQLSSAP